MDVTETLIEDMHPTGIEPNTSPKHFSIKITPDAPYFMGERIASPAFYDATMRPHIIVEYTLSATLPKPDLTLYESSIDTDPVWPAPNSTATVNAEIRNTGAMSASHVLVYFYDGDPRNGGVLFGQDMIPLISGGGGTAIASVSTVAVPGQHRIHVVIDPLNTLSETDETNNVACSVIPVLADYTAYSEGFEFGFGDWVYDFDTPQDGTSGRNRLSVTHPTRNQVYKGKQSLYAYLDGRGDDGTVWMERSVPVPRNALVDVKFSFAFGIQADLATTEGVQDASPQGGEGVP
ncbi:MAG: CARDB domain-containing protein [Planctomycetota bacterium]